MALSSNLSSWTRTGVCYRVLFGGFRPQVSGFSKDGLPFRATSRPRLLFTSTLAIARGDIFAATQHRGRHCFIAPYESADVYGLHFFEYPDARLFAWSETFERSTFIPGALQHVAFALPDETSALCLRRRLAASGVETTPPANLGRISNMLFRDNNGLLLEATWPRESPRRTPREPKSQDLKPEA